MLNPDFAVTYRKFTTMRYNYLIFIFLAFGFHTSIGQTNHLVSYQLIKQYDLAELDALISSFGIPQGLIEPRFELDYYKVFYQTMDALGTDTTIATGAIVVPSGMTCPVPIVSYQHGTTTKRTAVPSYLGGNEFKVGVLAAASTGSVVCMADYLGLGDSPGFHPYVNSRTEASACIDLLRTCRELSDSVGYQLNDQLLLFGYSQGGHATMALFKELETNLSQEFTVTACAPMSGPYYVSGIQAQTIIADTPYATPSYLPYVVMGQQEAYGNLYNQLSEIFIPPYDSLLPIWFDGTRGTNYINNRLPDTPNQMLDSAYFQTFKNDPSHFFWDVLRDNDLHNWAPTAPLTMYYCTADEQVFYQNSEIARDTMHALGATHVQVVNFGAFNHGGCAPFCFLQGLAQFSFLGDWSGGMTIIDSVLDVSTTNASDGEIILTTQNAVGNVTCIWDPALGLDSSTIQTNLSAGTYNVEVRDERGCYTSISVAVGINTSTHSLSEDHVFKIIHSVNNPTVYIESRQLLKEPIQISLFDTQGRLMKDWPLTWLHLVPLDLSEFNKGHYVLRIKNGDYTFSAKVTAF